MMSLWLLWFSVGINLISALGAIVVIVAFKMAKRKCDDTLIELDKIHKEFDQEMAELRRHSKILGNGQWN